MGTPEHSQTTFDSRRGVQLELAALFCAMTGVFVLSAMLPNYLVDFLHLVPAQMGFVMSVIGFGGFVGQIGVPGLSDFLGRKITAIASFLVAAILVRIFMGVGASPALLFALFSVIAMCCLGVVGLITGPISSESAPAGLVSSAIGIVVVSGEIFGGGIAPSIAGYVAQHYGIQNILYLALIGVALGLIVCLFLKETAPRKIRSHEERPLEAQSPAAR